MLRYRPLVFERGYSEDCIAKILVVLIPIIDQPRRLKEFRPISLCNVIYKVVTKVLVQQLRAFLDDLIGPLQSSFWAVVLRIMLYLPKKLFITCIIPSQNQVSLLLKLIYKKGMIDLVGIFLN